MKKYFWVLGVVYLSLPFHIIAHPKKSLITTLSHIYESHRFTLFCEQPFAASGALTLPRCKTCPKTPLHIRWIPIVPLSQLAASLPCYSEKRCIDKQGKTYGGLRCCEKIDPHYKKIVTDLRNYVPENPILSQLRKNYTFQDFAESSSSRTGCHFYVDNKNKRVSPPPTSRGFIARTYLYFHHRYALFLSQEEKNLFWRWHETYPLSEWEQQREQHIFEQQSDRNPYALRN